MEFGGFLQKNLSLVFILRVLRILETCLLPRIESELPCLPQKDALFSKVSLFFRQSLSLSLPNSSTFAAKLGHFPRQSLSLSPPNSASLEAKVCHFLYETQPLSELKSYEFVFVLSVLGCQKSGLWACLPFCLLTKISAYRKKKRACFAFPSHFLTPVEV